MERLKKKWAEIFLRVCETNKLQEAVLRIENGKGDFLFKQSWDNTDEGKRFPLASISKLFTAAVVFSLFDEDKLRPEDQVKRFFGDLEIDELYAAGHKNSGVRLTVADLLSQTSGLPDAYEEGPAPYRKRLIQEDFFLEFDELIADSRALKAHFAPGQKGKAHYADLNFELLGKIIEHVTDRPLADCFQERIFSALGLSETWAASAANPDVIPSLLFADKKLKRPQFLSSTLASGGVISNAEDLMTFTKAFYRGRIFDKKWLNFERKALRLQMSMGPIRYQGGQMVLPLGGVATLFRGNGALYGHSGSSGSFAFYYPNDDLYMTGDLMQAAKPQLAVLLPMRLALALPKP